MPTPEENLTVKKVTEEFPEAVLEAKLFRGEVTLRLERKWIAQVCRFCKEDPELRFDFLSDLCGVDYRGREPRFEVVYHLLSIPRNERVRLKAGVPEDDPHIATVSDIWPTANWHERECYDMFGIVFDGHPDLRRILMPEDWEGHPLRKDYPLRAKEVRPPFDKAIEF